MKHQALIERRDALTVVAPARAERPAFADAQEVAARLRPDVPLFLFAPETLRSRARVFLDGFPGEVAYAVKANPGPHVLRALAGAGIGVFDVASPGEVRLVRSLAPGARIHYHNPVKSLDEIVDALGRGVRRFAADCPEELAKVAGAVKGHAAARDVEIAVRFRLPASGQSVHDFSSKFGAAPDEAGALLRAVADRGFAPVLTFHPGSQCLEPGAWRRHIAVAGDVARAAGVAPVALNVGGGFPAEYSGGGVPALAGYFAEIAAAARDTFGAGLAPRLECEPGRGIVASSTSLLVRVKLVKRATSEVYLNDGVYGGLLEWYQAPSLRPAARVIRHGRVLAGRTFEPVLYGPTCDPLDRLPGGLRLPLSVRDGDHIELGPLGAYGAATSTRFNGYGEAEVIEVGSVLGA